MDRAFAPRGSIKTETMKEGSLRLIPRKQEIPLSIGQSHPFARRDEVIGNYRPSLALQRLSGGADMLRKEPRALGAGVGPHEIEPSCAVSQPLESGFFILKGGVGLYRRKSRG